MWGKLRMGHIAFMAMLVGAACTQSRTSEDAGAEGRTPDAARPSMQASPTGRDRAPATRDGLACRDGGCTFGRCMAGDARWLGATGMRPEALGFSADGERLAVIGRDAAVVLDLAAGRELVHFSPDDGIATGALSPTGDQLALSFLQNRRGQTAVLVFELPSLTRIPPLFVAASDDASSRLAFSPDGALLAVAWGGEVFLFETVTGEAVHSIAPEQLQVDPAEVGRVDPIQQGDVTGVAFVDGGKRLAIVHTEGVGIWLFDIASQAFELLRRDYCCLLALDLSASRDGRVLAVREALGFSLWDVTTGQEIASSAPGAGLPDFGPSASYDNLALSPDGSVLALIGPGTGAAGLPSSLTFLDVRDGTLLSQLDVGASARLAYGPCGDGAAVADFYDLQAWGIPGAPFEPDSMASDCSDAEGLTQPDGSPSGLERCGAGGLRRVAAERCTTAAPFGQTCTADADCDADNACLCGVTPRVQSRSVGGGLCLPATCRTNADCPGQADCAVAPGACGPQGLYCHTPQDECHGPADCPDQECLYTGRRWVCSSPGWTCE